jgi:hypothetical protein
VQECYGVRVLNGLEVCVLQLLAIYLMNQRCCWFWCHGFSIISLLHAASSWRLPRPRALFRGDERLNSFLSQLTDELGVHLIPQACNEWSSRSLAHLVSLATVHRCLSLEWDIFPCVTSGSKKGAGLRV